MKPLLEDDSVLKIGQNIKYDVQVMARLGITIAGHDDTMLISYVLEGGAHGHGMDELAERHLGHKTISYGEVTGSGKAQDHLRPGGAGQGARLCRRGCRCDAAALRGAEAAAGRRRSC